MNILIAAGHLPAPDAAQAGSKASYALARALAASDRIHLLAFATEGEKARFQVAAMDIFASWRIYPATGGTRLRGILRAPLLPAAIAARTSHQYGRNLADAILAHAIDAVVFDHSAMMQYAQLVPPGVVTVAILHDILTQSWERKTFHAENFLMRAAMGIETARMRAWERKLFQQVHLLAPFNLKDRSLIESMAATRHPVIPIQPWIDPSLLKIPSAGPPAVRLGSLLFWGAMDRLENRDAAAWAVAEILPRIRSVVPSAHLYLAGSGSEGLAAITAGRSDVSVLGFVDDVQATMAKMQVALLPLRLGAGIKVKILECMAAGLPVVTTEVGLEGIDAVSGVDCLVGENCEELAKQVIRLLQEPEQANAMGRAGQNFLHNWYRFEENASAFREALRSLVEDAS